MEPLNDKPETVIKDETATEPGTTTSPATVINPITTADTARFKSVSFKDQADPEKTEQPEQKTPKLQVKKQQMKLWLQDLRQIPREKLTFGQLFSVSFDRHKENDGFLLETQVRQMIVEELSQIKLKLDATAAQSTDTTRKFVKFEGKTANLYQELGNNARIKATLGELMDFQTQIKHIISAHENKLETITNKIGVMHLDFSRRIDDQNKAHQKLDKWARRPVDYYEVIERETKKVHDRCILDLDNMRTFLHDTLASNDKRLVKHDELLERHKKMYTEIKEQNHKQDLKVEQLKEIMEGFNRSMQENESHVEALKAQSLLTDLHFECFLPLQVASLSFEICHSIAKKKTLLKLRERFRKKVQELEKNLVMCCDPAVSNYQSIYRKNYYEMPNDFLMPKRSRSKSQHGTSIADSELTKHMGQSKVSKKVAEEIQPNLLERSVNYIQNATSEYKAHQQKEDEDMPDVEIPSNSKLLFEKLGAMPWHKMPLKNLFKKVETDIQELLKNPMQGFKQPTFSLFTESNLLKEEAMNDFIVPTKKVTVQLPVLPVVDDSPIAQSPQRPVFRRTTTMKVAAMPELPESINAKIEQKKMSDELQREKKMLLELYQEKKRMQQVMNENFDELKTKQQEEERRSKAKQKELERIQTIEIEKLKVVRSELENTNRVNLGKFADLHKRLKNWQKETEKKNSKSLKMMSAMEDNVMHQFNVCESMILQTELARLKAESLRLFNFISMVNKFKKLGKVHRLGQNAEVDKLKKEIDKGPDPDVAKKDLIEVQYKMGIIRKKLKKLGPIGKMELEACTRLQRDDESSSSSSEEDIKSPKDDDDAGSRSSSSGPGWVSIHQTESSKSVVKLASRYQKVVVNNMHLSEVEESEQKNSVSSNSEEYQRVITIPIHKETSPTFDQQEITETPQMMNSRSSEMKRGMSKKDSQQNSKVSFAGLPMKTKESAIHRKQSVAQIIGDNRRKSSRDGSIMTFLDPTPKQKKKKAEQAAMQQELLSLVTMLKNNNEKVKTSKMVEADIVDIVEETNSISDLIKANKGICRIGLDVEDQGTQTTSVIIVNETQAQKLRELERRQRIRQQQQKQLYGEAKEDKVVVFQPKVAPSYVSTPSIIEKETNLEGARGIQEVVQTFKFEKAEVNARVEGLNAFTDQNRVIYGQLDGMTQQGIIKEMYKATEEAHLNRKKMYGAIVDSKMVDQLPQITESSIEHVRGPISPKPQTIPKFEKLPSNDRPRSTASKDSSIESVKNKHIINKVNTFESDSKSNSDEGSYDSEEDDYVDIDVFAKYKEGVEKRLTQQELQLAELKQANDTVLSENMRLLKKISEIDWNVMAHAEILVTDTIQEFQTTLDGLMASIQNDVQKFKLIGIQLEAKHESNSLWLQSMQQMVKIVKDEFFEHAEKFGQRWETLLDFLVMQTRMNIQDEIDKETLSLVGLKETSNKAGQLPTGGLAQLDANCLSCGQLNVSERNHVYASFKTACLQYRPSAIELDQNLVVSRRKCAEMQADQIQKLVQMRDKTEKQLDVSKNCLNQIEDDIKSTQAQIAAYSKAESPRIIQQKIKTILANPRLLSELARCDEYTSATTRMQGVTSPTSLLGGPKQHQEFIKRKRVMTGHQNNKMANMMTETLLFDNKKIKNQLGYEGMAEEAKKRQRFRLDLPKVEVSRQPEQTGEKSPNTATPINSDRTHSRTLRLPKIYNHDKNDQNSGSLVSKPSTSASNARKNPNTNSMSIPATARSYANAQTITDQSQKHNESACLTQRDAVRQKPDLRKRSDDSPGQRSQRVKSGSTNLKSLTLNQRMAREKLTTQQRQNVLNASVQLKAEHLRSKKSTQELLINDGDPTLAKGPIEGQINVNSSGSLNKE